MARKHQHAPKVAASGMLAEPSQPAVHLDDFKRWERELRRNRMLCRIGRALLDGMAAYGALWVPQAAEECRYRG